ncbi:N-acetylglucosamine-6-sulfatase-like [Macrobrachium nipponense]|uniref:N-acetylglucosamine-6-sulfatase-like n=1 Tax=Macrobrachium nipponense TaxID=159736 RepID=UPI0030C880C8
MLWCGELDLLTRMECQQVLYLLLGFSLFVSVIYWSTPLHAHSILSKTKIEAAKPNFVFILTDDQDVTLDGMSHMPNVINMIGNLGVTVRNSFVASPLCCPSRSSILTGQYVHNHGAINNSLSGHCSSSQWQAGPEKKSFAAHLHLNGYRTFFAGKYLNQYGENQAGGLNHIPPGWDWWIGLKGNSRYYNYTLSVNGSEETHHDDPHKDYLTNVIRSRAMQFLTSSSFDKPFFMMLSTPSAHAPFTPEPKYATNFSSLKAPRTANFNVVNGKDKHWLLRLGVQPLPGEYILKVDDIFRNRLRTLLTVDDMVKDVIDYLSSKNQLENTYIIFTSDNGYHLGQFSLPLDKREPYETDIRVPLLIRGPMIPEGSIVEYPITNIDLAPTFLDLAGIPVPPYMDGSSMKSVITINGSISQSSKDLHENSIVGVTKAFTYLRRSVLIEHTGEYKDENYGCSFLGTGLSGCNPDFSCKCEDSKNNTYACVRQVSQTENQVFCKWNDNESFEEFYDLNRDPFQLNNSVNLISNEIHRKLTNLLRNLQRCRGSRCQELGSFVI